MDINQDIDHQKHAIDLTNLNLSKHLPENRTSTPKRVNSKISIDSSPDASTVSLSEEGRAASSTFDFNATADNLLKLEIFGKSKAFAKAHASISYENVKKLLD